MSPDPEPARAGDPVWDLVVAGGGPTGATAALCAARAGLRTLVLERGRHPRFHIGESLLPRNLGLLRDLGILSGLEAVPRVRKVGASFAFGHDERLRDYHFENGLQPESPEAWNCERAAFDRCLLEAARAAGAAIAEETPMRRILRLEEGRVEVEAGPAGGAGRVVRGRCLIDASGPAALVGRHLRTRRIFEDQRRVSCFAHATGVHRPSGREAGYPRIVMCDEGWFWFIPIDAARTSVGLVLDAGVARGLGLPASRLLAWGLERCPLARAWTEGASFAGPAGTAADFGYTCAPYAGPGYFLAGDAATFVDPIFSTGVCLGMMSAREAVAAVLEARAGRRAPAAARRRYARYVRRTSSTFFRLVRWYYRHEFRELFLEGSGPLGLHRALTSLLTGHVFPRAPFAVRWRMMLFGACLAAQRRVALAPRRSGFSLVSGRPTRC